MTPYKNIFMYSRIHKGIKYNVCWSEPPRSCKYCGNETHNVISGINVFVCSHFCEERIIENLKTVDILKLN